MQAQHQDIMASIYNIAQNHMTKNRITYSVFRRLLVQFPFEIILALKYSEKLKQFTCRRNICDK